MPVDDHEQFNAWAEKINYGPLDPEAGLSASAAMVEYLEPLVAERRANPTGDLLSELVQAEVDGETLSDARLYGFLRLLLPAGAETTYRVFGSALLALARDAALRDRVAADRSLVAAVIEETLRWETSVTMVSRRATTDAEIGGVAVAAGCPVTVYSGAANRDDRRWPDPDEFDIERRSIQHLSFGVGEHFCLGTQLARLETRVLFEEILGSMQHMEVTGEISYLRSNLIDGVKHIPMRFERTA